MNVQEQLPVAAGTAAAESEASDSRRNSIVMVRWALAIVCAYMVLFSEGSTGILGIGPVVIAVFLASNLVVGRLPAALVGTPRFNLGVAVMDTVLIAASLYAAGQVSVELLVLLLGVLVMTIAGLRLAVVAGVTMGITAASFVIAWLGGTESLVRSSMLVRAPFLLVAAVVYAWLVETAGRGASASDSATASAPAVAELAPELVLQREAIDRCREAIAQGLMSAARAELVEVAAHNRQLLARAGGAPHAEPSAEAARDAA